MPTILGAAASGMAHNQQVMDAIGHNVANAGSYAFKRTRALGEGSPERAIEPGSGRLGVAQTTLDVIQSPGQALSTGNPLHFAIPGDAFFGVTDFDGATVYSRLGALDVDVDGSVTTFQGRRLQPPLTVPQGMASVTISEYGVVSALNGDGERIEVGRLPFVRFGNPQGLRALGDGLYTETTNSGDRFQGFAGDDAFPSLLVGALEGSNVDIAEEITNMIIAQRVYTASAKTFHVGDQMLELATNLTR